MYFTGLWKAEINAAFAEGQSIEIFSKRTAIYIGLGRSDVNK